jgi:hypothetical protein
VFLLDIGGGGAPVWFRRRYGFFRFGFDRFCEVRRLRGGVIGWLFCSLQSSGFGAGLCGFGVGLVRVAVVQVITHYSPAALVCGVVRLWCGLWI